MSTVVASPPLQPADSGCDRVVFRNVPWEHYARLRGDDANRRVRNVLLQGNARAHVSSVSPLKIDFTPWAACHDGRGGDGHPVHGIAVDNIPA